MLIKKLLTYALTQYNQQKKILLDSRNNRLYNYCIQYIYSQMKKQSEIYSHKKFKPARRPDSKLNTDTSHLDSHHAKTGNKPKSSEKSYEYSHRFKVSNNNTKIPVEKIRMKTQMQDSFYNKSKGPYQPLQGSRNKDRIKINLNQSKKAEISYPYRNLSHIDKKNKTIKKLQLNQELIRIIKNGSLQKYDAPLSGKNPYQSFRKPHQSHRSMHKKAAIQDYVSSSLENLKPKKSLSKVDKIFQKKDKNTVIKSKKWSNVILEQQDTEQIKINHSSKQKSYYANDSQKNDKNRSRNYNIQIPKKLYSERDDSLEKFQIKFEKPNKHDLSKQEIDMYGDRFPDGFDKVKLLGRGGFSLVWLGEHKKSKKQYAVKQIITQSTHQTHIKQIWFGTYFFDFGGAPKQQFADHPGITNLVKLYYYFINKKDTWILYQMCGDSLGNALYDLKSQRVNNQKLYRINYKPLYERIRVNQNQLRKIILQVAKALELLAQNNIVHSDLKTQNILVRLKTEEQKINDKINPDLSIAETKLIDYGSSFVFNNLRQFSMATPQYMAPEILNFILYENQLEYIHKLLDYVQKYTKPWVIDVWSLGCVVLEVISGIPLWMSLKTIVKKPGDTQQQIKLGLFAVKGRLFDKIIRKQIQVIQNMDHYLYQQNYSGIVLQPDLRALLKKMLALNPEKRISPSQIIDVLEQTLYGSQSSEPVQEVQQIGQKSTISHKMTKPKK